LDTYLKMDWLGVGFMGVREISAFRKKSTETGGVVCLHPQKYFCWQKIEVVMTSRIVDQNRQ
jgi:hypothetical protein